MAMDTDTAEGTAQSPGWRRDKEQLESRQCTELDDLERQRKNERNGIIQTHMIKTKGITDIAVYEEAQKEKEQALDALESAYQQRRKDLQARHANGESTDDGTVQGWSRKPFTTTQHDTNIQSGPSGINDTDAGHGNSARTAPQATCSGTLPSFSKAEYTLRRPVAAKVRRQEINGKRRLMLIFQAAAPDQRKRQAPEPERAAKRTRIGSHGPSTPRDSFVEDHTSDAPEDLPATEKRHPASRCDDDIEATSSTERTITYAQVRRNATEDGHWDAIVEHPERPGQWCVIFCEQHQAHFKQKPSQGACKHLDSKLHNYPNRLPNRAINELGHRIIDCTDELKTAHNEEVKLAYAYGYQPAKMNRSDKHFVWEKLDYPLEKNGPLPKSSSAKPAFANSTSAQKRPAITNPKTFYIYNGDYDEKSEETGMPVRSTWPVIILGWDDQRPGRFKDLPKSLRATGLLEKRSKPPNCYIYNEAKTKIVGWAPGFEDGGVRVQRRKFPVMFFDGTYSFFWIPATALSRMNLDGKSAPRLKNYSEKAFEEARSWIARRDGYKSWEERADAQEHGQLGKVISVILEFPY
jgi:hypothetical protein